MFPVAFLSLATIVPLIRIDKYLNILISKCNMQMINTILKYSLLNDYQYGIDIALLNITQYQYIKSNKNTLIPYVS